MKKVIAAITLVLSSLSFTAEAQEFQEGFHNHDVVDPYDSDNYIIWAEEDLGVGVVISGDGSTNIDCEVYDHAGNVFLSDEDESDVCLLYWEPLHSGPYGILIHNRGDLSNYYQISVD